ncbi:MAG: DUF92 domain-containing protein [Balneolaceae bacterium]
MDRKLNYLFSFIGIVVFIFEASLQQQWNIFLGLILAIIFSFSAFLFRRLTLDGMFGAMVIGTFIFGLGGWQAAVVVLVFFITSAAISGRWKMHAPDLPNGARRNGLQVWANGFWLFIGLILATIFEANIFLVSALASIATSTADTWGTELGSTKPNSTYLITTFENVQAGTDGGISLKGTIAALLGSMMIGAISVYVFSLKFYIFLCIFLAGFSGSVADSYLGAIFQRNNRSITVPVLHSKFRIDNNLVNGLATGMGALLAIILKLMLS